jgi:hypothetical protein
MIADSVPLPTPCPNCGSPNLAPIPAGKEGESGLWLCRDCGELVPGAGPRDRAFQDVPSESVWTIAPRFKMKRGSGGPR